MTFGDGVSGDDPCDIYRRYNDAQNRDDLDALEDLIDEALSVRVNGKPALASLADDRRAVESLNASYPDYRRDIIDIFAAGDRVVAQWLMLGTPANSSLPPLKIAGCSIVRVRGRRLAEAALYYEGDALNRVMLSGDATSE